MVGYGYCAIATLFCFCNVLIYFGTTIQRTSVAVQVVVNKIINFFRHFALFLSLYVRLVSCASALWSIR